MESAHRFRGTPRARSRNTDTPVPRNDFGGAGDLDELEDMELPVGHIRSESEESEGELEVERRRMRDFTSLLPDRDVIDGLVTSNLLRTPSPFVDIPPFSPDAYRVYTQEYQDENFRKWVSVGLKKARHDPYPDMEVVREETPTPADVLLGDIMFRREKIAGMTQLNLENLIRDIHHVITREEAGYINVHRLCTLLHSPSAEADMNGECPCGSVMTESSQTHDGCRRQISLLEEKITDLQRDKLDIEELKQLREKATELEEIVAGKEKLRQDLVNKLAVKTADNLRERAMLEEKLAAREKQCLQLSNRLTLLMSEGSDTESNVKQEFLELLLSLETCQKEKEKLRDEVETVRSSENALRNETQVLMEQLQQQKLDYHGLEGQLKEFNDRHGEMNNNIKALNRANAELSQKNTELSNEKIHVLSENKTLGESKDELCKRMEDLTREKELCDTNLRKAQSENEEIKELAKESEAAKEEYATKCELLQKEKQEVDLRVKELESQLTQSKDTLRNENIAHVVEMESLTTSHEERMWEMEQETAKYKEELCALQKSLGETKKQLGILAKEKKQIKADFERTQLQNETKISQLDDTLKSLSGELDNEKEAMRKATLERDRLQKLIDDMEVQPSRCQRPLEELVSIKNHYQQEAAHFKAAHDVRRKEEEKRIMEFKKQMHNMAAVMKEQEGMFEKERKELNTKLKSLQKQNDQDIARWNTDLAESSKLMEKLYTTIKLQRDELTMYREESRLQKLADFRKSHSLAQGANELMNQRSGNREKTQKKTQSDGAFKYSSGGEVVKNSPVDKTKKKTCSDGTVQHTNRHGEQKKMAATTMSTQDVTCDVRSPQTSRAFSAYTTGHRSGLNIPRPVNEVTSDVTEQTVSAPSNKTMKDNGKNKAEKKKLAKMSAIYGHPTKSDMESKSGGSKLPVPQPPTAPPSASTYVRKVRPKVASSATQSRPIQKKRPRTLPPLIVSADKRDAFMQF